MTNWMTAAGLALIAGGLATLISFRAVIFGGGERRARRRAIEASRRRPAITATALPVEPATPVEPVDEMPAPRRRGRRGRRRALVAASGGQPPVAIDEEERGGLASIGLADEEEDLVQEEVDEPIAYAETCDEPAEEEVEEPEPVAARAVDRSDQSYGDRVEGWVRPEYQSQPEEPRPGEYWTPIPVDLAGDAEPSAKGYGWPAPVERLPSVPPYEPATGFDLIPVATEPTEVVPAWPEGNDDRPGRIRLPRSWASRNEKASRGEKARNEKASREKGDGKDEPRRRPRPRPRPDTPADNSTVYVSRHAAEPPH